MNVDLLRYSNSKLSKLQPYWNARNSSNRCDDLLASSESAWADDILGLNAHSSQTYERPLTAEVDAYLLDSQFSTTTLNFWQVRGHYIVVFVTYQSMYRKTSFVFRPFLLMLLTFYRFKLQLYPLNEYSPLQRRQQQSDATSSALSSWKRFKFSNFL